MGIIKEALAAYRIHGDAADAAFIVYQNYCGGKAPPRVAGMGAAVRMALRIERGMTIEQAAAREYVYRWHLAIKAPDQCNAVGRVSWDPRDCNPWSCVSVFGTPHTIGM